MDINPISSPFANPLATEEKLNSSPSQMDGVSPELERSAIFIGARLTQCAGILLRLSQETIAQAVILYTRFWVGPTGGSLRKYAVCHVSAASLYITAKLSPYPKAPRSVINVFAYLQSLGSVFLTVDELDKENPDDYFVSEGTFYNERAQLVAAEAQILKVLGFDTHVALPYVQCINYLQTLDVFSSDKGQHLARRAHSHLNSALFNPALLYLSHQPSALATAAIYLSAREIGFKLPNTEWWEVFDTGREELEFLAKALNSMGAFVRVERKNWTNRKLPITIEALEQELAADP